MMTVGVKFRVKRNRAVPSLWMDMSGSVVNDGKERSSGLIKMTCYVTFLLNQNFFPYHH